LQSGVHGFAESSAAFVSKKPGPAADGIHKQIDIAVTVDIRQHATGGVLIRTTDAGLVRDVLEAPLTEIAVKPIRSLQPAQVDVAPSVAIDIPQGNSRT
jgi:hypothetical protein